MVVDAPKIYTMWDGPGRPFIDLCLQSLVRHNQNVVILNWSDFDAIWKHDVLSVDHLSIVQKSDVARNYLLSHYGGLWVDADCITMKDYSPLMGDKPLAIHQRPHTPNLYLNGFMYAPKGSRFGMRLWDETVKLVRKGANLAREAMGPILVTKIASETGLEAVPHEDVMPIHWRSKHRFMVEADDAEHEKNFRGSAWCYMLTYGIYAMFDGVQRCDLLASRTMMGWLFRKALR